jgi:carbon monoxide dehydrogenase subunit G
MADADPAAPIATASPSPPDPAKDPQVARLLEAKKTLNWNHNLGADRYGHAEALVDAPAEKVAKAATEFGQYKALHRKFATARVVAKEGDQTDVYMRYPVQIGPVKIELYEVMRFAPPRAAGTTQVIEARGVKGDMKRSHTVITVKPVDAKHSLLSVDILLVPPLPAPQSYVDEELRDGASDFVNALRDKAQGAIGPVLSL